MARRAAKVDANQPEIIQALRQAGALVQPTHTIGRGFPDLVCAFRGIMFAVELKDGSRRPSEQKLTPDEMAWHEQWQEAPVYVVNSVEAAMEMLDQVSRAQRAPGGV